MVFLDLNVYTALKVALVWQDHNKKFDFYEYLAFSCKHALAVEIFFSQKKRGVSKIQMLSHKDKVLGYFSHSYQLISEKKRETMHHKTLLNSWCVRYQIKNEI
jgi:hypothetical protein